MFGHLLKRGDRAGGGEGLHDDQRHAEEEASPGQGPPPGSHRDGIYENPLCHYLIKDKDIDDLPFSLSGVT